MSLSVRAANLVHRFPEAVIICRLGANFNVGVCLVLVVGLVFREIKFSSGIVSRVISSFRRLCFPFLGFVSLVWAYVCLSASISIKF